MIYTSAIDLSGREREYIDDCLSSGWLTQGKYVRQFEESFAEMSGVKYAIACNSGTSALHLAMLALDIGPSDSVIVPSLTYVATANAVRYCGARVYFADIKEDDWCIDPENVYVVGCRLQTDRGKWAEEYDETVIPVDLYDAVASRLETWYPSCIVIDSAHSTGAKKGHDQGLIATHSFYASKIIACGEGGMVTTDDQELADRVRLYRGQGATIPGRYHHSVIGYNYRMTDLQAAIGSAQLERLPEILARRREIVDRYRSNLSGTAVTLQGGERASGWVCAVLLPENADRDLIAARLYDAGIETRPFFEPLHTLPPYIDCGDDCPVAESIAKRGLCLPTHTLLADSDIDYVSEKLMEAI